MTNEEIKKKIHCELTNASVNIFKNDTERHERHDLRV